MRNRQSGGTIIGFILGLLFGLGAAAAVVLYVNKVPVPFLNRGLTRSADQDAAETKKNQNWDPNSPMYGRNPARTAPAGAASGVAAPTAATTTAASASRPASAAQKADARLPSQASTDPLGDLAKARSGGNAAAVPATAAATAAAAADAFDYFVQAGAFRTPADAEAQRAKLAIMGWEAKVSEREQAGRTVFRVRVGPFSKRDDAEQLKEKIDSTGTDSALVRVQR